MAAEMGPCLEPLVVESNFRAACGCVDLQLDPIVPQREPIVGPRDIKHCARQPGAELLLTNALANGGAAGNQIGSTSSK